MSDVPAAPLTVHRSSGKKRRGASKSLWRRIRTPLAQSQRVKGVVATLLAATLRLVRMTNRRAGGALDLGAAKAAYEPAIIALWHGQHLLAPTFYPRGEKVIAMVSRSADAELNALVVEKFGIRTVRGSGGRERKRAEKGGAQALVALKRALDVGTNVCMIADIPHGTPREAGMGIVTLARLSGRPIVPVAIATSRRKVLESTWDKTTINLPFGRCTLIVGDPVSVPADATEAEMEARRAAVTAALNEATERAYRTVDRRQ